MILWKIILFLQTVLLYFIPKMTNLNRSIQPALSPFALPIIANANQAKPGIFVFDKPGLAVFKLDIVFINAGLANEKVKKANQLCLDLLFSGTSTKNAYELNEAFDFLGAYIQTNFDYYKSTLTIYGLSKYFEKICMLLNEVLNDVHFTNEEFDLLASQKKANIKIQEQKTGYQSRKLMNKEWFGENHSLGKGTTIDDYESLNLQSIIDAYDNFKQFFVILTSGDDYITQSELVHSLFNKNLSPNIQYKYELEHINTNPSLLSFYELKDSKQSSICIRLPIPGRNHVDYPNIFVANLIFGGYFGSRLMKNIREDKGWTYGMYSYIKNDSANSYIEIAGDIKLGVEEQVFEEIRNEIKRLQTDLINEEEWHAALNYFFGQQQESFDNIFNVSDKFLSLSETNNELTWFNTFYNAIKLIEVKGLQEIFNTYFKTDSLIITWSGSKK
jgi:zinc protease